MFGNFHNKKLGKKGSQIMSHSAQNSVASQYIQSKRQSSHNGVQDPKKSSSIAHSQLLALTLPITHSFLSTLTPVSQT